MYIQSYFCGMDITLNIKKAAVYNEVAKTTSYVGLKLMDEDSKTYERVFTTDDDRDMLERFWRETCSSATDEFKQFIISVSNPENSQVIDDTEIYTVEMSMPSSFDVKLVMSVEQSLMSYFVNSITAKWFCISNRKDAEYYQQEAVASGDEVRRKIFFRKKPKRIIPID